MSDLLKQEREVELARVAEELNLPPYEFIWDEDGVLKYKNSGFAVQDVRIIPSPGCKNQFSSPEYYVRFKKK